MLDKCKFCVYNGKVKEVGYIHSHRTTQVLR